MNKRTIVLCASVGTLVLSAAHAPAPPGPSGSGLSPSSTAQSSSHIQRPEHVRSAGPVQQTSKRAGKTSSQPKEASFGQLSAAYGTPDSARAAPAAPPVDIEAPTLWLARAIYSETKLPHEQELVAWVVRNRVETAYRGKSTYREVVLDPYQFSAFNPGSSKRHVLKRLGPETPLPRWRQALWVARYVRHAGEAYRPFSVETRHFYSERSMKGRLVPYWADGSRFVPAGGRGYSVEERRFRFYKQIS